MEVPVKITIDVDVESYKTEYGEELTDLQIRERIQMDLELEAQNWLARVGDFGVVSA